MHSTGFKILKHESFNVSHFESIKIHEKVEDNESVKEDGIYDVICVDLLENEKKRLISTGCDQTIRVYNYSDRREEQAIDLSSKGLFVYSLQYRSPYLYGSCQNRIVIYELEVENKVNEVYEFKWVKDIVICPKIISQKFENFVFYDELDYCSILTMSSTGITFIVLDVHEEMKKTRVVEIYSTKSPCKSNILQLKTQKKFVIIPKGYPFSLIKLCVEFEFEKEFPSCHKKTITALESFINPKKKEIIVCGSDDGTISTWNVDGETIKHTSSFCHRVYYRRNDYARCFYRFSNEKLLMGTLGSIWSLNLENYSFRKEVTADKAINSLAKIIKLPEEDDDFFQVIASTSNERITSSHHRYGNNPNIPNENINTLEIFEVRGFAIVDSDIDDSDRSLFVIQDCLDDFKELKIYMRYNQKSVYVFKWLIDSWENRRSFEDLELANMLMENFLAKNQPMTYDKKED